MAKIVCRCHDLTLEEIEEAIEKYKIEDLETLKRVLRIGMGECQGRTCLPIVLGILARKTGKSPDDLANPSSRPPSFPTKIGAFAGVEDDEEVRARDNWRGNCRSDDRLSVPKDGRI